MADPVPPPLITPSMFRSIMRVGVGAMTYTPLSWYWIVGNRTGVVFSSAVGDYIDENDPAYQQWLSDGGRPTQIPTDGELADVLANQPSVPGRLVRHAGWTDWGNVPLNPNQLNVLTRAGVTINSTGTPALNGTYALDSDTRTRINTNMVYIQNNRAFAPNNAETKVWNDQDGGLHTFQNTDSFIDFAHAVTDYYAGIADWAAADGVGDLPSEPVIIP